MVPSPIMSKDRVDETTLKEIAEACHVPPDQIEDIYGCTPLQNSSMAESSIRTGASVFQFVLSLSASVDIDRFCDALSRVTALNSVLRTRLADSHLGLVQVVTAEKHHTQRRSGDVEQYLRDDKARPLDLGVPLFRSAIIDRKLVLTMHHAVMDHSSIPPLFRDVLCVYRGQEPQTGAPFKEFVAHCIDIDEAAAKSFWASRFKGAPSIFPKVDSGYVPLATQKVARTITSERIGAGVLLAHVPSFIEAAWALTARTYAGSDSVAFGLILSGRTSALAGVETTLGPTIAIIPMQVNIQRSTTVEAIVKEMTTSRRQLQTHPALQYGLANIRGVSEAARIASSFQTLLNVRPTLTDPDEIEEVSYDYMEEPQGAFSLCLNCNLTSNGVLVEAVSDPGVVCESQLRRIVNQFEHTLQSLLDARGETKLDRLQSLNPQDRSEIFQWNKTIPETVDTCLHEIFRARAREQPEAVAVEAGDGNATYRELDELSDRLAHELRRRGVSTGNPVAFIFEKSLWTIVAVMGIMKAGGACVPIEKADPPARKKAIISGAKAKVVLTSVAEHANSANLAPDVFEVSERSISALPDTCDPLDNDTVTPSDLAYIIFTSGSTGVPKGVMLEHRCLASSLSALADRFGWLPGCRMLQFAAHVWDISMGEIFGALLFGGCLCIPSEEARHSSLASFIESSKVNWAWLTPTVLRTLSPEDVPGLKSLLSIGEPVDAAAAKTWGKALRLINGWGPCEASILSASAELAPDSPFPESIGTPVGGALWIVNLGKTGELAPVGAVGELLVEGPGVARGYLNDKVRTAASFISTPTWVPSRGKKARHLYRTGDLAKYNTDGSICFVGRQDNQVKVRGQRFELGELESALAGCDDVRDVFTTTKISEGRTELVAIICLSDPQLPREKVLMELSDAHAETVAQRLRAVRDHVGSRLPSFMIPTIWLAIEQMPRTASAKLDRTSLRDWLKTKNLSSARAALDARMVTALTPPTTTEERIVQSIWASVLGISQKNIGCESSFVQLGGDSILAMQVASRCRKAGYQITTATLLRNEPLSVVAKSTFKPDSSVKENGVLPSAAGPHGESLSSVSQSTSAAILAALNSRVSKDGLRSDDIEIIVPATDTQAFMLATSEIGGRGYYIDFSLEFSSALDTAKLRKACEQVAHHHPILRTTFVQNGTTLYQVTLGNLTPRSIVEVKDNPDLSLSFRRDATLARFHIISEGTDCQRLYLEIHHALYDAISLGLIFHDLDAAYSGKALSNGPQFHSWISHVEGLDHSASRQFWTDALRDSSMPYLAPPIEGVVRGYPLDEELRIHVPLRNMTTALGTPSSVMKAAWALVVAFASGSEDVVFGETSADRYLDYSGIDQVRGPCVNILPVRARLDRNMTLASFITQMQEQSASSLPHHHLGYRSIVKDCTSWPSSTRFSSAMVYQNHGVLQPSLTIGEVDGKFSNRGKLGDSADIWAIATPEDDKVAIELRYSLHTLPSEQIQWISKSLVQILELIPSSSEWSLSQLGDSVRSAVGSYRMPPCPPITSSGLLNGHPPTPSITAHDTVTQAWKALELFSAHKTEDVSMFSSGADVVSALLLSEYYTYRGYDMSTEEVVKHPSRLMQMCLLDSKWTESTAQTAIPAG